MTTPPDKPDPARGWRRAEKLLDEGADRLPTMSDEDFEREMDALPDPAHIPTAEELLARGAARAKRKEGVGGASGAKGSSRPVPARKMPWGAWLAAAALVAVVVGVALNRNKNVASPRPDDDAGEPGLGDDAQPVPIRLARAEKLRETAYAACAAGRWRVCQGMLHAAKNLDPAGDADPRVQAAYLAARAGMGLDGGR